MLNATDNPFGWISEGPIEIEKNVSDFRHRSIEGASDKAVKKPHSKEGRASLSARNYRSVNVLDITLICYRDFEISKQAISQTINPAMNV